jgi:hypothetical protein
MLKLNFSNLSNNPPPARVESEVKSNTNSKSESPNIISFYINFPSNSRVFYSFRSDLTVGYVKIHTQEECGLLLFIITYINII